MLPKWGIGFVLKQNKCASALLIYYMGYVLAILHCLWRMCFHMDQRCCLAFDCVSGTVYVNIYVGQKKGWLFQVLVATQGCMLYRSSIVYWVIVTFFQKLKKDPKTFQHMWQSLNLKTKFIYMQNVTVEKTCFFALKAKWIVRYIFTIHFYILVKITERKCFVL